MNLITKIIMKIGNKFIPLYYLDDKGKKKLLILQIKE